ncbi:MAG: hypothetical protein HRF52_03925 [Ignavibacterium sp.]|jgi:hypothetical protein|uniref:hypothetical protein n=1 Tax=Ignavibacterium sp. TaxID=2651167 RepID=UPI00329879FC
MDIIIQIVTGFAFIIFASFAEGIEWKERYLAVTYTEQERLNKAWHWLQFFERVFAVLFGYSVGMYNGLSYNAAKMIFAGAVLFWIIYDVVINYYSNKDLFKPSKYSTSWFERIHWLKPILLIAAILLFITGCSGTRIIETIKVDTIKAVSPTIEEELEAKMITDTIIVTNKILEKDTIIDVRYYPVEKKFYIKAKPDTVTLTKIDTLVKVEVKEGEKNYYTWIAVISLTVIALIMLIIIKK